MPATGKAIKATPEPAAFVAAHMNIILAYSRGRRFRPASVDPDEFLQEMVLTVMEALHTFRTQNDGAECPECGGSGCSTWLGFRAMLTRTRALRHSTRENAWLARQVPIEQAASQPASLGSPRSIEAKAQVAQVLRRADFCAREAAITVLTDMDGDQVQARLGIKLPGRNYRLRKLAEELNS